MNNAVDKRILKFLSKHHVLNLCTCSNNTPWSCSCFYAFDEQQNRFIITSYDDTFHSQQANINPLVSGTIVLETKIIGKIQGIQFTGKMIKIENNKNENARKIYLNKFPFAVFMKTTLWAISVEHFKYTDNRLGFGKKIVWKIIHNKQG